MAGKKISQLPATGTLADGDLFITVQVADTTDSPQGSDKRRTAAQVATYVAGTLGAIDPGTVTKASIGLGNVENTALSTWHGSTVIDTVGTIAAGIWHGTPIADAYVASAAAWNAKQPAGTYLTSPIAESDVTGLTSDLSTLTTNVSANTIAIALRALDSAVVHVTGAETIGGTKTFSATIAGSIGGNAATATTASALSGSITESQVTGLVSDLAGKATAAQGALASSAVQSISMTTPSVIYSSPVTWSVTTGAATATLALATQTANRVLAGPSSGGVATPAFRALVAADMPTTGLAIASHYGAIAADADAATITFDCAASDKHAVTLGGNRTLALSGVTVGQQLVIVLTQDATGSRTVTWFTTIRWAGGTAPTLTTTAGKADLFTFLCYSAGNFYGFVAGQAI